MRKLYVGNIPFSATEADLRAFFAPIALSSAKICADRESGKPRGFAFVEVADAAAAEEAIAVCNGADLGGRKVLVSEAHEKPGREGRGGPRGGKKAGKKREWGEGRRDRDNDFWDK